MSTDQRLGCLGAIARLLGWDRCRDGLPVAVVTEVDARYVDLTTGCNSRWVGAPQQVRLATTSQHVVAAVQEAARRGKRVAVRSGGHCYEDFVYNPDVEMVIDLSGLNEVGYDATNNAISVGAGALLSQVYATLYRTWGITIPGGSCATVAAGGHIVGGGYGLLSRLHGLTVDYLYGVEVVTVDARGNARLVVATRNRHDPRRDLWWAHTGGGGGNFGIVTRYLLRDPDVTGHDPSTLLPRPPAEVFLSTVALDWADVDERAFTRLVKNFGTWHEQNSDPYSEYAGLFGLLKLNKRTVDATGSTQGQIVLLTQADATRDDSRELLDRYLRAVFDGVEAQQQVWYSGQAGDHLPLPQYFEPRRVPWLHATMQLGGAPTAKRGEYKSAYHTSGLTDDQIAASWRWLTTEAYNNADALVQLDSYGCNVNVVDEDATAEPHRSSVLKLQYQAYWSDPDEDDLHLAWMRGFYREVYASTGGVPAPGADTNTDGCFVNYADIDLSDLDWNQSGVEWSTLYYKGNYERLQQVKRKYDPGNFFRHAQSVQPG